MTMSARVKPNHLTLSSIGNMHPAALDYLHYSESHAVLSSTPPVPGLLTQAARRADGEPRVRAAVSRRRRCTRRQDQRREQRRARGLESSRGRARLRVVRVRREGLRRGNGCMCMCMCMSMCMCVHALLPPGRKLPDLPPPPPPPPPPPANLVDLPRKVRPLPLKPPRSGEPPRSERLLW